MNRRRLLGFLAATPIGILVPAGVVPTPAAVKTVSIAIDEAQAENAVLNSVGRIYGLSRMVSTQNYEGRYRLDSDGGYVETDEAFKKRLTALITTGNPNS